MKLTLSQANELNNALSAETLRSRHISGVSRIKLSKVKTLLKNELSALGKIEIDILTDHDIKLTPNGIPEGEQDDLDKANLSITETRKAWSMEADLNFLAEKELLEYCKDVSTAIESVLFEYLLYEIPKDHLTS